MKRRDGLGTAVVLSAALGCSPSYRIRDARGARELGLEDLVRDGSPERLETQPLPGADQPFVYRLGVGDVLDIYVLGHPELSSQRVNLGEISGTAIQDDGRVHIPVVGAVQAEGDTLLEFQDRLRTAVAKYVQDAEVTASILQFRSQRFHVMGAVQSPGSFPADGRTFLLDGLSLAGGVLPTASLQDAHVLRGGEVLPIDLYALLREGATQQNVVLQDRDVIFLPNRSDRRVYVLGEVSRPGIVPFSGDGLTLAEALASAGGPTLAKARAEVAVIRGSHGAPEVYRVNFERALLVDDKVRLRSGDRVIVAPTGLATASRYMSMLLPFLQGAQAAGIAAQGAANVAEQVAATSGP